MSKRNRWNRCGRDPDRTIAEIRRSTKEQNLDLWERQNGSHWIGKVPDKGSVVVPRHGEIPKGTWGSIMRMLRLLGIAAFVLFSCYLSFMVLFLGG